MAYVGLPSADGEKAVPPQTGPSWVVWDIAADKQVLPARFATQSIPRPTLHFTVWRPSRHLQLGRTPTGRCQRR